MCWYRSSRRMESSFRMKSPMGHGEFVEQGYIQLAPNKMGQPVTCKLQPLIQAYPGVAPWHTPKLSTLLCLCRDPPLAKARGRTQIFGFRLLESGIAPEVRVLHAMRQQVHACVTDVQRAHHVSVPVLRWAVYHCSLALAKPTAAVLQFIESRLSMYHVSCDWMRSHPPIHGCLWHIENALNVST